MLHYLLQRLLQTIPLLLSLSFLVFALFQMVPGDYLSEMQMDPSVSPAVVQDLRQSYGLDQPLYVQYFRWLAQTLRGNLGYSFAQRRPVSRLMGERLVNTAMLTLTALALILAVSLPLAAAGALAAGRWGDRVIQLLSLAALSAPPLLASLLLLYLAFAAGWFPGRGLQALGLPALALALPAAAFFSRNLRLELIEALGQPFVVSALGKGLPPGRVLYHAVRYALNPLISLVGVTFGGLLSGAVVVEKVFDWPGLGSLTVDAILSRDLFVVVACILLSALLMIGANLAADLLLALNDPRIREP